VSIDGERIPTDRTTFCLRGQRFAVEYLPTISDVWWHMGERALLHSRIPPISTGMHRIECSFAVSLFVHTPKVDSTDLWPTLRQDIGAELSCAA